MSKVGDEVEVQCGKCKEMRYHTVAAMGADGSIEKVVCGYCGSSHKYRDPAKKSPGRPRTRASRIAAQLAEDLSQPSIPYDPRATYQAGNILDHKKFGLCRVDEIRGDRIDVTFGDGTTRVLMHARG